jgi:hypothetical protein
MIVIRKELKEVLCKAYYISSISYYVEAIIEERLYIIRQNKIRKQLSVYIAAPLLCIGFLSSSSLSLLKSRS